MTPLAATVAALAISAGPLVLQWSDHPKVKRPSSETVNLHKLYCVSDECELTTISLGPCVGGAFPVLHERYSTRDGNLRVGRERDLLTLDAKRFGGRTTHTLRVKEYNAWSVVVDAKAIEVRDAQGAIESIEYIPYREPPEVATVESMAKHQNHVTVELTCSKVIAMAVKR